jgi:hypothetical protein
VKYHEVEHGYRIMHIYDDTIESQGYRNYWVCQECGHEEIETGLDRYIVDSKLKGSYEEYF